MRFALAFPFLLHLADALHYFQRGVASACSVARFLERRPPEGHDRVIAVFVGRAMVLEDETGHVREILIVEERQGLCVEGYVKGVQAAIVAEDHGTSGMFRV